MNDFLFCMIYSIFSFPAITAVMVFFWRYCTFVPPRVRVRATVKLSAAFFHDESSITIGGVRKCNSTVFLGQY